MSGGVFCRTSSIAGVRKNRPNGSQLVMLDLFRHVTAATRVAKSTSTPNRLLRLEVMQQVSWSIKWKGYVVIGNEIVVCVFEYTTESNMVPPGVRRLNKQTLDFACVVMT